MDTKNFVNNASIHLKKHRIGYGLTIILILLLVAILVVIRTIKNNSLISDENLPSYLALPTQALLFTTTPTVISTPLFTSTVVPVSTPSNQWVVVSIDAPVRIGHFDYLTITLKNLGDGSLKRGQCQQPKWESPEPGHIYVLTNTYADYWLFIPIEGIESELQRFVPIP